MSVTRRRLIHLVGRAGGISAAYRTMAAMGLLAAPAAYAGPPALPAGSGAGSKVLILGAGIAGMVAALELGRAGYDCTVLEARGRAGGRNWSLRASDVVEETGGRQPVAWDAGEHLYFNPGPARLPYDHQGILGYCRELGVALEVLCNDNRAAFMHDDAAFAGAPQRNGAVVNDTRGYIAELAAKAVDAGLLDQPVSDIDKERLRAFLRAFGALEADLVYRGSARAGLAELPGAGTQSGRIAAPLDLRAIVASEFWQGPMQFGELHTMQATMLQPVGGMGRIGEAFGRMLGERIVYRREITDIRRTGEARGARVLWRDARSGERGAAEADYVICTLPCPVLRGIDADFSPALRAALAAPAYVPAGKIAFQAERRFWEQDHNIYGGISWTSRDITQIWYPTAGLHAPKGILVAGYVWSDREGEAFAAKPPARRAADALADAAHIHPGCAQALGNAVSVAWPNIPFTGSAWAEWSRATRKQYYPVLLAGEGPFLFAGEHVSYVTGWQEGAVLSAHVAVAALAERVRRAGAPARASP
ncbi:MAG: FAD-dependent oxidoreductase [Acidisphaera sp.]|nr:FAD-dependent oxidoreductase [Acidisphaera sp.]